MAEQVSGRHAAATGKTLKLPHEPHVLVLTRHQSLAAIAIARGAGLLSLLIMAVAALIAVVALTLGWLALTWLLSRVLLLNAALLRACMNEKPPATEKQYLSDKWLAESVEQLDQTQAVLLEKAEDELDEQQSDSEHLDSQSPDAKSKGQHQQPIVDSEVQQQQEVDKQKPETEPKSSPAALLESEISGGDAIQETAATNRNTSGDSSNKQPSKRRPPRLEPRPKLTAEGKKAQEKERKTKEQASWLSMMGSGNPGGQMGAASRSSTRDPKPQPIRPNPFNSTEAQLAEAREFSSQATKGPRKQSSGQQYQSVPNRTATRSTVRSAESRLTATPAAPAPMAGDMPPHMRKSIEAKARKAGVAEQATTDEARSAADIALGLTHEALKDEMAAHVEEIADASIEGLSHTTEPLARRGESQDNEGFATNVDEPHDTSAAQQL